MVAGFFCKTVMCRLLHLSIVAWSILSGTPQFEVIRKTTKKRRIIVDNGNASSRTSAQISGFLSGQNVNRRTVLTRHPMTFFYFSISRNKCVVYDFCQIQFFAELIFQVTKNNPNDGRMSKRLNVRLC